MPTINKLPLLGTPSSGDQIPVYAPNSGDARRMSITALTDYMQGALDLPDNSDEVSFLQSGTGAVTRTVQSKLRDVVSVKDFGAVGDGVADDIAAIQAANAACVASGDVLLFPDGTYVIGSNLTISADVCFLPSAVLSFGNNTLTISGVLSAGATKIFDGASVVFGSGSTAEIMSVWWGENTTPGSTDMTAPMQRAINASSNSPDRPAVVLPLGKVAFSRLFLSYDVTNNPGYNSVVAKGGKMVVKGHGRPSQYDSFYASPTNSGTVLYSSYTSGPVIYGTNLQDFVLKDFAVIATTPGQYMVNLDKMIDYSALQNVMMVQRSETGNGLLFTNSYLAYIKDSVVFYRDSTGLLKNTGVGLKMYNPTQTGGLISIQNSGVELFGQCALFGDTAAVANSIPSVSVRDSQFMCGAYAASGPKQTAVQVGYGISDILFDNVYFEAFKDVGVQVFGGAQGTVRNSFFLGPKTDNTNWAEPMASILLGSTVGADNTGNLSVYDTFCSIRNGSASPLVYVRGIYSLVTPTATTGHVTVHGTTVVGSSASLNIGISFAAKAQYASLENNTLTNLGTLIADDFGSVSTATQVSYITQTGARVLYASAMPTTGSWRIGDLVLNTAPAVTGSGGYATTNQKYVIFGWSRVSTGAGNVLNTDWVEMRVLTGT